MKSYLESLTHLEKIDVKDISIDCKKFKLIDMSQYQKDDILYINRYVYYKASDYALKAMKKGYAIYCNYTVYYLNTLDVSYFSVSKIKELEALVNKTLKNRKDKEYTFSNYLIESRYYVLVENYIKMYNSKMVDRKWVKDRLNGKVSDINRVLDSDFPEIQ